MTTTTDVITFSGLYNYNLINTIKFPRRMNVAKWGIYCTAILWNFVYEYWIAKIDAENAIAEAHPTVSQKDDIMNHID
jgi:hypothetical protein